MPNLHCLEISPVLPLTLQGSALMAVPNPTRADWRVEYYDSSLWPQNCLVTPSVMPIALGSRIRRFDRAETTRVLMDGLCSLHHFRDSLRHERLFHVRPSAHVGAMVRTSEASANRRQLAAPFRVDRSGGGDVADARG